MGRLLLSVMTPAVAVVVPFLVDCYFYFLLDVSLESDLEPEMHVEQHQPRRDDEGQAEARAVRDVEQRQQEILPGDTTHCKRQTQ